MTLITLQIRREINIFQKMLKLARELKDTFPLFNVTYLTHQKYMAIPAAALKTTSLSNF